jgi:chaperone required for assembly of F1-ATPase
VAKSFKRFYKQVDTRAADPGHAIVLDGKAVKTPGARPLVLPTLALAEAVAEEWRAQGEQVIPGAMPLTQLASTALDRVGPERAHIRQQLLSYAGTDLLCYRADSPSELVERQSARWQPLLDWAAVALDASLVSTQSLQAVEQPAQALAALGLALDRYDDWRLSAVQSATAAMGSLVLALALAEGRIDAAQAFDLSQLDENFQIERWGEDYEAAERRAELTADIGAARRLLDLLG